MVFSTMGRLPSEVPGGKARYHSSHWDAIVADFHRTGYGYADYDQTLGYGLAITKPTWYLRSIERNKNIRLVMFGEAVWDNHQDVWAIQKRPIGSMFDPGYEIGTRPLPDVNAFFFGADLKHRPTSILNCLKRVLGQSRTWWAP